MKKFTFMDAGFRISKSHTPLSSFASTFVVGPMRRQHSFCSIGLISILWLTNFSLSEKFTKNFWFDGKFRTKSEVSKLDYSTDLVSVNSWWEKLSVPE